MIASLLVLGGLVVASAFFSGTEVAMFSLRRVDRQQMLRSKHRADALAMRLLARPRRLITTVLIGNEAVNVSVSALVASMVALLFAGRTEIQLVLLSTAIALPLLLLVGEITPKAVAMKLAVSWSRAASRPLWVFGVIVSPIRIFVRSLVDLLVRPFCGSVTRAAPRGLSEEEFRALVEAGRADGEVDAREHRLIDRVFEFDDKTVAEVMVPRARIFALARHVPNVTLLGQIAAQRYSRVPIYEGSLDNIVGIVYVRDLVAMAADIAAPPRLHLHDPLFVPATIPIEHLFQIFKQRKTHMALVVSEHGELLGLVTMEDLLKELFGEVHDERGQQQVTPTNIAAHEDEP